MELISKNELIKSIELGIKQLEESEKNIIPNELGSPGIVIPCAIMLMKSMIEVVNMCDIIESRPKGEWIETDLDCGKRHIRCNQCWYTDCEVPKEKIKDMDYCPQCGAEMEK